MNLSVVQFCPVFCDKAENIRKIRQFAEEAKSDIIVFPELCTTGYFFQSRDESSYFAEPFTGPTCSEIQEISTSQNKIIIFGFAEKSGDNVYNSAAILFPDSSKSVVYRKTHLFYKERFCFDEGDTGFFVVKDDKTDINIGIMICYDWRFPEAARTLGLLGADLIVCPSNLVTKIWPLVMPARAIENKVYLAVANRYGIEKSNDESVEFNGSSGIWSYNGEVMTKADKTGDIILTVEIEPEKTRDKSFNEYNDIFKDRRPEFYIK